MAVIINNCDNKSLPYSFWGGFRFKEWTHLLPLILDSMSLMYSFKIISFVNQEGKWRLVLPFWFSHIDMVSQIEWKNVVSHNFKLFADVKVLTFLASRLNSSTSPSLTSRTRLNLVGFDTSYRHTKAAWQT